MQKKLLLLIVPFWMSIMASAQVNMGAYFVSDPMAVSNIDPSKVLEERIAISVGHFFLGDQSNGVNFKDVLGSEEGSVDMQQILSQVKSENAYAVDMSLNILGAKLRLGSTTIEAGYNLKVNGFVDYPEELVRFIGEGNAQYIDQSVDIGPSFALQSYHEYYLGAAKKFGPLSIGLRGKFLLGIENVSTDNHQLDVYTNPEIYQSRITSDYEIFSSRAFSITDLSDFDVDFDRFHYMSAVDNKGFALDFGISLDLSERTVLTASIIDIGSIEWTSRAKKYTSKNEFVFDGVDLVQFLDEGSNLMIEDSLYQILQFEESNASFTTKLETKYFVGFKHEINEKSRLGALAVVKSGKSSSDMGIALNYQRRVSRMFNFHTQYAYYTDNPFRIGLGASLHISKLHIFILTDDIISSANRFSGKSSSFSAGLTLRI